MVKGLLLNTLLLVISKVLTNEQCKIHLGKVREGAGHSFHGGADVTNLLNRTLVAVSLWQF
jgi:hypothetical protein